MMRLLIYIFPAVVDMVLGAVMFLTTVRMAESGASATAVTLLMTTWSFVYMICAFALSKLITSRNAAWLNIASGMILAIACMGFIVIPDIRIMYLFVVVVAIANAMFFAPFQIFMKAVERNQSSGIVRSTALYTFAWSSGIAMGPFVTGYLWTRAGWNWCHILNATLAVLTSIGIYCLKHYAHPEDEDIRINDDNSSDSYRQSQSEQLVECQDEYAQAPDLAWLAWFGAGLGILVIMIVRGILPITGVSLEIPRPRLGIIFALISMTQAIVGLSFIKSRIWMFRIKPIIIFSLFGAVSLLGFAYAKSLFPLYLSAICAGVYAGAIFFYFVFHSLVHPTKAPKYIAINESVVGLAGIIGPLIGGLIVDSFNLSTAYIFGSAVILLAGIFKAIIHYRNSFGLANEQQQNSGKG